MKHSLLLTLRIKGAFQRISYQRLYQRRGKVSHAASFPTCGACTAIAPLLHRNSGYCGTMVQQCCIHTSVLSSLLAQIEV